MGCVVLGIGIFALVDGQALMDLVNSTQEDITLNVFTSAAIILIAVSVFVVIICKYENFVRKILKFFEKTYKNKKWGIKFKKYLLKKNFWRHFGDFAPLWRFCATFWLF